MDVGTITALISALGIASLIPKIIDVYTANKSGKAAEEKRQNRSALGRLAIAEERADDEASFRRTVEEWAGKLVYMLRQMGVPDDKIPLKPERKTRVNQ